MRYHEHPSTLSCDVERDVLADLEPQVRIPDSFLHSVAEQYGEFEAWTVLVECSDCEVCGSRMYDPNDTGLCEICDDRAEQRVDAMVRWQQVQDARTMGEIEVEFYERGK